MRVQISLPRFNLRNISRRSIKLALKDTHLTRSLSEANKIARKNYPRQVSDETKDKIRKKRIEYLKNQNDTFVRRNNGEMSYGEKFLHDLFLKHNFYERYDIVNEFCEYPYFLDFAFVNEKVDVEFDGHWHFLDKKIEKDKKRDAYLQEKGWRIYRIAYYELKTFNIDSLIKFIGDQKEKKFSHNLIKYKELKQQQKEKRLQKQKEKKQMMTNKRQKFIDDRIQLLLTIDLNKYGWMNEASKLLRISHSSVRRFVNRYGNDLIFFKRKT